jgi:hypothetical protein
VSVRVRVILRMRGRMRVRMRVIVRVMLRIGARVSTMLRMRVRVRMRVEGESSCVRTRLLLKAFILGMRSPVEVLVVVVIVASVVRVMVVLGRWWLCGDRGECGSGECRWVRAMRYVCMHVRGQ